VDLEATVAVQAAIIAELRAVNATQARVIATLEARVAELECRLGKDSSNSSRPPSSDGLGKPTRAQRRGERAEGRRAPGNQPSAPGAHLAQVAQPDEMIRHVPDRCGGCGAEPAERWWSGSRPGRCSTCRRCAWPWPSIEPSGGAAPAARSPRRRSPTTPRAAACYGPGVRALCCYLLVHQHLPVDRAARLLDDVLGVPVATGTLAAVLAEGAAGLEGFRQVVREQLAAAEVAHFDETGARVAGRLHWVHSASTGSLSLHAKRGKVAMDAAEVLPGLPG
jgi:uncharacterized coiled-coil protein SlyX